MPDADWMFVSYDASNIRQMRNFQWRTTVKFSCIGCSCTIGRKDYVKWRVIESPLWLVYFQSLIILFALLINTSLNCICFMIDFYVSILQIWYCMMSWVTWMTDRFYQVITTRTGIYLWLLWQILTPFWHINHVLSSS